MATGTRFGVAPFLFRRKSFGFEEKDPLETNKSSESSKKLREVKGFPVHNSCSVAGNFITMMELRKKILTFRDLIDLPPCIGSASLNELLIGVVKDLHKLHPDNIPRISTSEMEGISTNQALTSFCNALTSVGDMWIKNNEWRANGKYDTCDKMENNELHQLALAILDDMINVARERLFDTMDEDDQMKEYYPQTDAFGKALSDSYSDNKTPLSCSPETPTSVLPEITNCYTKVGEFKTNSYSPPLLLPSRIQAIGKLNPIDVKRLSFHMLPHIDAQDSNLFRERNQTVNELKPETQAKTDFEVRAADIIDVSKECKMTEDVLKILMFNLDKITSDKGKNQIASPSIPPPRNTRTLEGETMDVLLPTQPLPNLQPSVVVTEAPPTPYMLPNIEVTPPIMPSNAIESPLVLPLPPILSPNAIVSAAPPPSPPLKLLPNAIAGPPPPTSPPPITSGNLAPPPPPPIPPMMSLNGSLPSQPPPMPVTKGGTPPPPPALGGAKSLRPKKAATKLKRSSQMGNLYRLLKGKVEGSSLDGKSSQVGKMSKIGASTGGKQGMADALAEMTKRSAYFQQIEEDVKNHAKSIMEVKVATYSFQTTDMAELLKFHKYVESHLEKLTDESQVLARFEGFPTKKLEALRMAAALYSKLDVMVNNLQNWKIEAPLGQILDKAENYFNKIKGELDALERTKDEETKKFQGHKIHFDFGILVRIKELMVDVSSGCMELALKERREAKEKENAEYRSKTAGQKKGSAKMLWKAFQFAFRVYTFAGGHDDRADKLTRELAHEIESDPHH